MTRKYHYRNDELEFDRIDRKERRRIEDDDDYIEDLIEEDDN